MRRSPGVMRRVAPAVLGLSALIGLAACSGGSGGSAPTFTPVPSFAGDGARPGVPEQPAQPPLAPRSPASSVPAPSAGNGAATDPAVVATHLNSPVGLVVLPDGTALVGERATGRIVRVQPVAGQPVQTLRTLPGLSTSGDGGLLDLALSPTYFEDNLIFAYVTTPTDNRVVDFTLNGPVTPVLTGIPRGQRGNTGRIVFGADSYLYVGTGDAGNAADSNNLRSLAGKVLRVTDIGRPAPGNPFPGSAVYSIGYEQTDALCTDAKQAPLFQAQTQGQVLPDPVNLVKAGTLPKALVRTPDTGRNPGGCTVDGGVFYLTSRDGQELLGGPISISGSTAVIGKWGTYLDHVYGRLRTVVTAPDGALWLTTTNRDGSGKPIAADERVIRIQPPAQSGHSPA